MYTITIICDDKATYLVILDTLQELAENDESVGAFETKVQRDISCEAENDGLE